MIMSKEIPSYIMIRLRQREGLDPSDTSHDEDLLKKSPVEMVRECVAWELGDGLWANMIALYMFDCGAKPEDFDE